MYNVFLDAISTSTMYRRWSHNALSQELQLQLWWRLQYNYEYDYTYKYKYDYKYNHE